MSRYISKYVSTCDMCLCTKVSRQPPVGELNPLPVPDAPWDMISVDFIVELLESEGKDAIMVVVDLVTKCGHFVDTVTTLSAAGTAKLYVQHIWKHHGLPGKAVSDRGPQFVAEFMRELYQLLGIKLAATTAYHPQGNGQTERVNQELNSTFDSSLIRGRTIGLDSSHLQSFNITIMYTLRPSNPLSSWILDKYPVWALNPTNPNLTLCLLMSSKTVWRMHWKKPKQP